MSPHSIEHYFLFIYSHMLLCDIGIFFDFLQIKNPMRYYYYFIHFNIHLDLLMYLPFSLLIYSCISVLLSGLSLSLFFFLSHFGRATQNVGILVPWPGIELVSPDAEARVLTTGLPGKSPFSGLMFLLLKNSFSILFYWISANDEFFGGVLGVWGVFLFCLHLKYFFVMQNFKNTQK